MATQIKKLDDAVSSPIGTVLPNTQVNSAAQPITHVTVLNSIDPERPLTKHFYRNDDGSVEKKPYADAWNFSCRLYPVSGIEELGELLSELEQDRSLCIIRGEPRPGFDLSKPVRRTKNKPDGGGPYFRSYENGVPWVMIDFDDTPCPSEINAEDDPNAAIEYLISLLPDEFQNVTCCWQWSSGAGVKGWNNLRAHLWFWLDRPVPDDELKEWAENIEAPVDKRLFNAVQVHYTATPIFDAGVADPVQQRSGLLRKEEMSVALKCIKKEISAKTTSMNTPFDTAAALDGVPEGERDNTLWSLACKLRYAAVPITIAYQLLERAALSCDPSFEIDIAREKVDRAYKEYSPNVERTDAGNAAYFAQLYGDQLRYDHARKRWFVWCRHWWTEDRDGEIERMAKQAMLTLLEQAIKISDPDEQKRVANHAIRSRSAPKLKAMLSLAQSEHPISVQGDGWDTDGWLFGVANGVVDLRTGEIRVGRKEDQITLHSNVRFDPNAKAPRWYQFLDEVFESDESLIEFVARAVGYSLTGDVSEECLFMLHGTGANGKTKFLGALNDVLGAYAHNIPFTSLEALSRPSISNDIASLVGRRFVMASETNETTKLNEGRIKGLTGGDPISARFLYGEYFTFHPASKFWLAVNHKPKVSDDSYGFWRRIRLIPFERTFDQETADKNLEQKLKAEAEGILAWAIRGCLEWQRLELNPPARVTKATEEYRQENDQIAIFLEDRCVLGSMHSSPAQEMYNAYVEWAKDQGMPKQEIMSNAMFGRRMSEWFEKKKARTGTFYIGVLSARQF